MTEIAKVPVDPFRADAVPVYRWLAAVRLEGGATVDEIASQCFPLPDDIDPAAAGAVLKRSRRRVLDSLVWLRHSGVTVLARPDISIAVEDRDVMHTRFVIVIAPQG